MTQNLAQIVKICKTPEELDKCKQDFSNRGLEFMKHYPAYTYEITVSTDEEDPDILIVTFILRPKSNEEVNKMYDDY
jgi:hypothetical protein